MGSYVEAKGRGKWLTHIKSSCSTEFQLLIQFISVFFSSPKKVVLFEKEQKMKISSLQKSCHNSSWGSGISNLFGTCPFTNKDNAQLHWDFPPTSGQE